MKKLLLLLTIITLAGCEKDDTGNCMIGDGRWPDCDRQILDVNTTNILGTDYHWVDNSSYGAHEREILDIIYPAQRVEGVVVTLHGGAYVRYDKDTLYNSQYTPLLKGLLDNNIAVVNANYKYLDEIGLDNPTSSGNTLMEWTKHNFPDMPYVMAGVSAGSGISLYNGLRDDHENLVGIVALEMQDLNVHQWEDVFPALDIAAARAIEVNGEQPFDMLYNQLYAGTDPADWGLYQYLDDSDPALYIKNTPAREFTFPFGLYDFDNLYHNVGHAELFANAARDAGVDVTTDGDIIQWILTQLRNY